MLILLDQLEQVSSGTVFKNDPQVVARFVPVKEFQNVSVLKVVKDTNFVQHLLASVFLDRLDRYVVDRLLLATLKS